MQDPLVLADDRWASQYATSSPLPTELCHLKHAQAVDIQINVLFKQLNYFPPRMAQDPCT